MPTETVDDHHYFLGVLVLLAKDDETPIPLRTNSIVAAAADKSVLTSTVLTGLLALLLEDTMRLFRVLLGLACVNLAQCQRSNAQRELVNRQQPYYRTTDAAVLGAPNHTAALGNPLKGLFGGIRWSKPPLIDTIPLSLEWFNLGLGKVDEVISTQSNLRGASTDPILLTHCALFQPRSWTVTILSIGLSSTIFWTVLRVEVCMPCFQCTFITLARISSFLAI